MGVKTEVLSPPRQSQEVKKEKPIESRAQLPSRVPESHPNPSFQQETNPLEKLKAQVMNIIQFDVSSLFFTPGLHL